jgi:hypothetical protein
MLLWSDDLHIAYTDFEEWNKEPTIANIARTHYGSIDKLELYPGLHAEGHNFDGFGHKYTAGHVSTMRNGLLYDAVALVRFLNKVSCFWTDLSC